MTKLSVFLRFVRTAIHHTTSQEVSYLSLTSRKIVLQKTDHCYYTVNFS